MSNMVINTNVVALNSHRNLKTVGLKQEKASQRLSSGYRVNSAADDAAGLAISEKMRAQIRGLDQASRNAADGISLVQTAEGGMQEIDNMLQRMRELIVQASNDTNDQSAGGATKTQGDRQKIQGELNQLAEEIDSMADRVEFNKKAVINGNYADGAQNLTDAVARMQAAGGALATANSTYTTALTNYNTAQADMNTINGFLSTYNTAVSTQKTAIQNAVTAISTALAGNTLSTDAQVTPNNGNITKAIAALTEDLEKFLTTGVVPVASNATAIQNGITNLLNKHLGTSFTQDGGTDSMTNLIHGELMTADTSDAKFTAGLLFASGGTITFTGATTAILDDLNTAIGTLNTQMGNIVTAYDAIKTAEGTLATAVNGATLTNATLNALVKPAATATYSDVRTYIAGVEAAYSKISDKKTDTQQALGVAQFNFDRYESQTNSASKQVAQNAQPLFLQVGANAQQKIEVNIGSVKTDALAIGDGNGKTYIDVVKASGSEITDYITAMDESLTYVTTERAKLGAIQNRLDYNQKSLDISSENLSASESRIRDADMAKEMMNMTSANVLQQAATSMLAQANQSKNSILQLLQ